MAFTIVTGYTGAPHVTPQQDRYINQGSFGTGTYVLPTGNQFAVTITSAMQITVRDGAVSLQGCVGCLEPGSAYQATLDDGTSGMKRIDYLCARYKRAGGGVESMSFSIKKGTPVAGTPTPPSYTTGSIEAGDTDVEYPLWRIDIDGLSIASVSRVAPVVKTQAELMTMMSGFNSLISGRAPCLTFTSGADVNTARSNMSTGDVFVFFGSNSFSQDVLGLATQTNAFGIGFKNAYSSVALLVICGGNLYYTIYSSGGAGTVYNPVNLTTNI